MPPKESQKQKQKQTVIVNIGDKLLVKKKKRKPKKKAAPRAPPRAPPPAPFPPQDFARVIFQPQPPLRPDENLAVQLNSVTKQLQQLQEKQKHRTGNLMAGQKAMEREAQQLGDPEPEPEPEPEPAAAEPEPAAAEPEQQAMLATPEQKARRGRPPGSKNRPKESLAAEEPQPVAEPKMSRSVSAPEGLTKSRKSRSDKDVPRGQLFKTVAKETLAQGGRLATILQTPPAPEEQELGEQGSGGGGMVFA